jgi:hypothetical protein
LVSKNRSGRNLGLSKDRPWVVRNLVNIWIEISSNIQSVSQTAGLMRKRDPAQRAVLMQASRKLVFGVRPCETELTLQLFAASIIKIERAIEVIFQF